jgi:hypothetical protein
MWIYALNLIYELSIRSSLAGDPAGHSALAHVDFFRGAPPPRQSRADFHRGLGTMAYHRTRKTIPLWAQLSLALLFIGAIVFLADTVRWPTFEWP